MKIKFVIFLVFLSFSSCVRNLDNPVDPESSAYEPPSVTILQPGEGDTMKTTAVLVLWEGNNPRANEFRYRLVDYSDWTDWVTYNSALFDYLDDVNYRFEIEVRYKSQSDIKKFIRNFSVDAIKGPTLKFYRLRNVVSIDSEFTVGVWVEDVSRLKRVKFKIDFDNVRISLLSVDRGRYVSEKGFDQSVEFNASTNEVSTEFSGGISGSGEVIKLKFKGKDKGISYLEIKEIELRDENGELINPTQTERALVEIK
jgi:hypothetical protein